jgi:hypothetical protein
MSNQLTISFNSVHRFENNANSQAVLETRREDFNEDNWEVLKLLLKGQRLRVIECAVARITGHLPRRICDLREYNIAIEMDMVVPNGGGRKIGEYYMKPEEISRVMIALIEGIRFQRIKKAA